MEIKFDLFDIDNNSYSPDQIDLLKNTLEIIDDSLICQKIEDIAKASLCEYIEMLIP